MHFTYISFFLALLQTLRLRECMLAHRDYYAPLLEEEEAEMEAARQAAAAAAAAAAATEGDSPPPAPQGEGDGVVSPGGDSS